MNHYCKFPVIHTKRFKTRNKPVVNKCRIFTVDLPNINSFSIKLNDSNLNMDTTKQKNLQLINDMSSITVDNIKRKKLTLNNESRKVSLQTQGNNEYKSINSNHYNLDYNIIRYLNKNKSYKNIIPKNKLIPPNFISIEQKLRQKYINIAKEYDNKKNVTEKNEEVFEKNISENSSFSENDEIDFQNNIAQKILIDDRNRQKNRINSNYIKRKNLYYFNKFHIDKNKLDKLILNYNNNKVKSNVFLNEFIKDYNRHFKRKELYSNQLIRMNSLRGKNFEKVKNNSKEKMEKINGVFNKL